MSDDKKPRKRVRRLTSKSVEELIHLLHERGGELIYSSLKPEKLRHSYFAASMLAAERGLVTFTETSDGHGIKLVTAEPVPS